MKSKNNNRIRWGRYGISLVLSVVYCFAFLGALGGVFRFQMAPAALRFLAIGSGVSLLTVLLILLSSFLVGRFYCSYVCPLGVLQEVFGKIKRGPMKYVSDSPIFRFALMGVVWGLLLGGNAVGFFVLDPYSNFGRMVQFSTIAGMVAWVVLIVLIVWKRRIFCTMLCPVGAMLGFFSKCGPYRISITDKCVRCGRCERECPSGCIDSEHRRVDNERCVRCMGCMGVCPTKAIHFGKREGKIEDDASMDLTRRAFLVRSGVLLAGLGVGWAMAKSGLLTLGKWVKEGKILPPGAKNMVRFSQRCTGCQLCVKACPSRIIVPAEGGVGPVRLDMNRGVCDYGCHRCAEVCPTGAIEPLTLEEKQQTQIAVAHLDAQQCMVFQEEEPCGRCAEACPVQAIVLRANGAPRPVKADLCIGCGACWNVCPKKAIELTPLEQQVFRKKGVG